MSRWILLGLALACGLYAYVQLSGRRLQVSLPRWVRAACDGPAPQPLGADLPAPLALAALLAIATWFAVFEVSHAAGYSQALINDFDEGSYTMMGRLLLAGYRPFADIYIAQPAWLIDSLSLGMRLLDQPDAAAGHVVEAIYGVLALGGVAWIAWLSYGRLAALVATAVLALSPGFVVLAHVVEAEMPTSGAGLLAIGAAVAYAYRGRRWLLAASGLAGAASLEMKVQGTVFLVPLALWVLVGLTRHAARRGGAGAVAADLGLLAATLLLPIVLTGLLFSPAEQLDQVVLLRFAAMRNMPLDVPANEAAVRTFLGWDLALVALGALGTLGGLLARPLATLAHLVWLGTTVAFVLLYHPQIMHQLVVLLPPVAVLAGGAVAGLRGGTGWRQLVGWAVAALAVAVYGLQAPALAGHDSGLFFPTPPTARAQLAAFVAAHTAPGEMIVTDDMFVALDAQRLVPPPLADSSSVRISAGYLTAAEAIAATERYHVRLVALWRGVYAGRLPDYVAWLESHGYQPLAGAPPGATVLARPRA